MQLSHRTRGILFAQMNALCAGTMMAMGKEVTKEIPPAMFVALMYTIVAPINTIWWLLTHFGIVKKLHAAEGEHQEKALCLRSIAWLLFHTGASVWGIIGLWEGLHLSNAAAGSLLSRIEVVVAIILGIWLLKERFTKWHWLGFVFTITGMVIVRWAEFSAEPVAFAWLLSGAVGFGIAEYSGKVAVRYWPVPRLMVVRAWIMWAVLSLLWLIREPGWHELSATGWIWLFVSALLGPLLSRNSYMLALSYLPVSQVVLLNQAQPLYAALVGFLMRNEIPAPLFYLGALAIILGNVVLVLARGHKK